MNRCILFVFFLLSSPSLLAQRKIFWFNGGQVTLISLKNGKMIEEIPLGTNVVWSYDTFFKTYAVSWKLQNGNLVMKRFDYVSKNNERYITVREYQSKAEYRLDDTDLTSKGEIIIGSEQTTEKTITRTDVDGYAYIIQGLKPHHVEDK